jgi:hypothetical protein
MIQIMDAALAALQARSGVYWRGVDPRQFGAMRARFLAAHQAAVVVQYEGYASIVDERMQVEAGGPIPARFKHLQYLNRQP